MIFHTRADLSEIFLLQQTHIYSENLLIDIALNSKSVLNNEDDLFLSLKQEGKFVLVTIGAGDIDLLVNPIKTFLHENF